MSLLLRSAVRAQVPQQYNGRKVAISVWHIKIILQYDKMDFFIRVRFESMHDVVLKKNLKNIYKKMSKKIYKKIYKKFIKKIPKRNSRSFNLCSDFLKTLLLDAKYSKLPDQNRTFSTNVWRAHTGTQGAARSCCCCSAA